MDENNYQKTTEIMEEQIINQEQVKPKGKGKVVLIGVSIIGLGTLAFFGWRKLKGTEEEAPTEIVPDKSFSVPSTKATTSVARNDNFPIKRGSKGERVKTIQQVLVKSGLLDAKDVIGEFGPKTEAALKKLGLPTVITEDAFTEITVGKAKPEGEKPPPSPTPLDAEKFADGLWSAAKSKNFKAALSILLLMKSTSDYTAVSDIFKTKYLNGVRQTLVNGMLNSFSDLTQKETLRNAFKLMGLKYDGITFSLSGISTGIITKSPTKILDAQNGRGIQVSKNTILGIYEGRKGKYTKFKNNGRHFFVPTSNIKFL